MKLFSGIHRQQTPGGSWVFRIMDALGSLRGVVNPIGGVLEGQDYAPYGTLFGQTGTAQTAFGFTGEVTDASGLVYLRARYYLPGLGVFPSLDPVEEGNRHGYVGGYLMNFVDLSGMVGERPERWGDSFGAPFRPESAGELRDSSGRISTKEWRMGAPKFNGHGF